MIQHNWMNDTQKDCYRLYSDLVGGDHHIFGKIHPSSPSGILINSRSNTLSTYDFDSLTRLVFMAHDRSIRAEIVPSGPNMIGIMLHKRNRGGTATWDKHPTIESALNKWRERNPVKEQSK